MNEDQHVAAVRRLFDEWAQAGRAEGMQRGHAPAAREAFERLGLQPGQHYLDIGCGNGYSVRWAAELDPSVQAVGLDLSAEMIRLAREQSSQLENVRFVNAPFPLPLLKARTFHAILSMEVFYYLPDVAWGMLSAARLLVPGGLFACVVDHYEENPVSHDWAEQLGLPMHRLSERGWRDVVESTGLTVVEQRRLCASVGEPVSAGSLLTLCRRPQD